MGDKYQLLLDEVRQNYASVVWTHKIQEKQTDIYREEYKRYSFLNIIVSGMTSCGIVSLFYFDCYIAKSISVLISFISFFLSTYLKKVDFKKLESQHRSAANQFVVIRNRLLHVIAELHMQNDFDQVKSEYEDVLKDLNELYKNAPSTNNDAEKKAGEALNDKKEYTYTEEEIDKFLPPHLKGGIKK